MAEDSNEYIRARLSELSRLNTKLYDVTEGMRRAEQLMKHAESKTQKRIDLKVTTTNDVVLFTMRFDDADMLPYLFDEWKKQKASIEKKVLTDISDISRDIANVIKHTQKEEGE